MRLPASALRCVAHDRWSGQEHSGFVVPPQVLDVSQAVQVNSGEAVPLDRPLKPRPRIITEL